jgi:ketosteroid isomerase-like protein
MLALASAAGAQPKQLPAAAAQAAAIVDRFHVALHRGDTRGAALLLADDAVIFEEGYVEQSKAEYASHHLPADAQYSAATSAKVVRRSGGGSANLAWVATEGRTTGKYKGKPVDSRTTETMVLRRDGGTWKIVHVHWSSRKVAAD